MNVVSKDVVEALGDFAMAELPSELVKLLWSVVSVILGFQITVFVFRLQRETSLRNWEVRHFPLCEYLNLVSIWLSVVGVFIMPLVGRPPMKGLFAAAMILFAFYPVAATAHYRILFRRKASGHSADFCSTGELILFVAALVTAVIVGCLATHS
jgi:hypothetical protein